MKSEIAAGPAAEGVDVSRFWIAGLGFSVPTCQRQDLEGLADGGPGCRAASAACFDQVSHRLGAVLRHLQLAHPALEWLLPGADLPQHNSCIPLSTFGFRASDRESSVWGFQRHSNMYVPALNGCPGVKNPCLARLQGSKKEIAACMCMKLCRHILPGHSARLHWQCL